MRVANETTTYLVGSHAPEGVKVPSWSRRQIYRIVGQRERALTKTRISQDSAHITIKVNRALQSWGTVCYSLYYIARCTKGDLQQRRILVSCTSSLTLGNNRRVLHVSCPVCTL